MDKKLSQIFDFLKSNRRYNKKLQEKSYFRILLPYDNTPDKITALLFNTVNTQSQVNIDNLSLFFKKIYEKRNQLTSLKKFINLINPGATINYKNLYEGLQRENGWGKKTAALFTKTIYHIHNGNYSDKIKIWDDVPKTIAKDDRLYLPVDKVITVIFNKLNNNITWNFDKVNLQLQKRYKGNEIEVWDDLWFWGFITQKGSNDREFKWNEAKYWILLESDKNPKKIQMIKNKAEEFLEILNK